LAGKAADSCTAFISWLTAETLLALLSGIGVAALESAVRVVATLEESAGAVDSPLEYADDVAIGSPTDSAALGLTPLAVAADWKPAASSFEILSKPEPAATDWFDGMPLASAATEAIELAVSRSSAVRGSANDAVRGDAPVSEFALAVDESVGGSDAACTTGAESGAA
jgi:hypothetical protein